MPKPGPGPSPSCSLISRVRRDCSRSSGRGSGRFRTRTPRSSGAPCSAIGSGDPHRRGLVLRRVRGARSGGACGGGRAARARPVPLAPGTNAASTHGRAHRRRDPGGDYLGLDVNRAARIAAVGWGGQVVISDALRGLVEHDLPEGVAIRSLGVHRLKDLSHPEHLFDLVIEGLPPSSRRSGASRFPQPTDPAHLVRGPGRRSPGRERSSPRTGSSR